MLIISQIVIALCISWSAATQEPKGPKEASNNATFANQTTCNRKTYTYERLAGFGYLPGNARDKFGDTLGGIGSDVVLDRSAWKKAGNGSYTGLLWALPDRGW